jgi:putative endonuclease
VTGVRKPPHDKMAQGCDPSRCVDQSPEPKGRIMYYVYVLTNWNNRILYTGVTGDLNRRICEHKEGINEGFTKKYKVNRLVYFEETDSVTDAIAREKQIKSWRRVKKDALINAFNPEWTDLFTE